MRNLSNVKALTFDVFGTVLDLAGSLVGPISDFLKARDSAASPAEIWKEWRTRQRLEQYQDNIVMMGHSGYLTVARRACRYVLQRNGISAGDAEIDNLMASWRNLAPFPDVVPALERLKSRFRLVVLSNGEPEFLEHLVKHRIRSGFDATFSVQAVGAFKPHPAVYRKAAEVLGLDVDECLMVSSNSFDVMGARMCGFRGAFVNRERLPYEETSFQPDLTVSDFAELADVLTPK